MGLLQCLLLANFVQDKPAIVPAEGTIWVFDHSPFRIIQALVAEWVISGESSKFGQEAVARNVVIPCCSHWLGVFSDVDAGKDLFDSAKFGEGIDLVGA